jgi:hypothetical protein
VSYLKVAVTVDDWLPALSVAYALTVYDVASVRFAAASACDQLVAPEAVSATVPGCHPVPSQARPSLARVIVTRTSPTWLRNVLFGSLALPHAPPLAQAAAHVVALYARGVGALIAIVGAVLSTAALFCSAPVEFPTPSVALRKYGFALDVESDAFAVIAALR